jgi:acyl carrier protein
MDDVTNARVEKHLRKNFKVPPGPLKFDVSLRGEQGLGWFDLDVIQLVMDLEDDLDIEITDAEDQAVLTVGDVFELVERKLKAPAND